MSCKYGPGVLTRTCIDLLPITRHRFKLWVIPQSVLFIIAMICIIFTLMFRSKLFLLGMIITWAAADYIKLYVFQYEKVDEFPFVLLLYNI